MGVAFSERVFGLQKWNVLRDLCASPGALLNENDTCT